LTGYLVSKENANRVRRMEPAKQKGFFYRSRIFPEVRPARKCNPCTSPCRVCTSSLLQAVLLDPVLEGAQGNAEDPRRLLAVPP
jgi:hypothetical protein